MSGTAAYRMPILTTAGHVEDALDRAEWLVREHARRHHGLAAAGELVVTWHVSRGRAVPAALTASLDDPQMPGVRHTSLVTELQATAILDQCHAHLRDHGARTVLVVAHGTYSIPDDDPLSFVDPDDPDAASNAGMGVLWRRITSSGHVGHGGWFGAQVSADTAATCELRCYCGAHIPPLEEQTDGT